MSTEIVWSNFAEKQLDKIFLYYLQNAGKKVAIKMIQKIIKEPNRLQKSPFVGQEEEFLKGRKVVYRYVLVEKFKIIYSVDEVVGLIKIADVFDTRQNPEKILRKK